jgi:hypothetical protein
MSKKLLEIDWEFKQGLGAGDRHVGGTGTWGEQPGKVFCRIVWALDWSPDTEEVVWG